MKRKQSRKKMNARRKIRRSSKGSFTEPRSLHEYLAMPPKDQEIWDTIGQMTTEIRSGATLSQASRKFGLDPRRAARLAKSALRKRPNGRWGAKKADRLLRILRLPNRQGLVDIGVPDSRQATVVANYWNAVDRYRDTGHSSALQSFHDKYVTETEGKRVPLMTDLNELDRLISAGQLSFETLYARVA